MFSKNEKKQGLVFLLYNLFAYFIIFVLLGFVAIIAIDNIFYNNARTEITQKANELMDFETFDYDMRLTNQRMLIAFFDEEGSWLPGTTNDFLPEFEYKININTVNEIRTESLRKKVAPLEATNDVPVVYYLTLLRHVEADNATYFKIYINIDGEVHARDAIINVYIICASVVLILSILASYLLSKKTMKPIMQTLEKQKVFVSDASHELRTPIAIVQSKIENILADPNKTIYEVSEDLAISLKELSRLNKLTSDLLMLARGDNENITLQLEYVDVNQLITTAIEPFVELANIQNKTFAYQGAKVKSSIDKHMINQVLIILLDNALLYTNEGDKITVRLTQTNIDFTVEIIDTGIGIDSQAMQHIFERFYRADSARNRESGGSGLGLAIAQSLIEVHKGRIFCESNIPKGSKFIFTIPKSKPM